MPFYSVSEPVADFSLGLWHVTESDKELALTFNSIISDNAYQNVNDELRRQRLATLALVNQMTGIVLHEIGHDVNGKPLLPKGIGTITISHSKEWVVVGIDKQFRTIGVDIELVQAKLEKVATRFLNPAEWTFIETIEKAERLRMLTLYWCAKETLYKILPGSGHSFQHGFLVEPFELKANIAPPTGSALVTAGEFWINFKPTGSSVDKPVRNKMNYLSIGDYELVYCIA